MYKPQRVAPEYRFVFQNNFLRTFDGLNHIKLFPQCDEHLFFLGSRCTQPLTPGNAHALRYEFSKWRTGQRGKLKKQSDFAMNSQHTPSLERRIHGRKIQTV